MENREYYESIKTERAARAVIAAIAPPGDFTTPYVLAGAGSGLAALRLAVNNERIEGLGAPRAHLWRRRFDVADTDQIRANLDRSLELGQRVLIPGDADWPAALDVMSLSAPAALWAQGNTSLLSDPLSSRAAIIGSDTPSQYAAHVADELAGWISADGRTVVTQPQRGIAAMAASSALHESSQVITVVPYGLDYDGPDREVPHSRVASVGLLVSERPPGSRPYRVASMSSRNLIAALSGATTVVESPSQSEWMQIASIARDYGRKVGAVPGRITDESSRGSNILLRDAGAHLVTDGSDIADLLDGNTFRLDLHTLMQGSPTRQTAQATGLSR